MQGTHARTNMLPASQNLIVVDPITFNPRDDQLEVHRLNVTVQAVRESCYAYADVSIVLSAVVIALCRAIRVVCSNDVSMIVLGVEGADQGEEEPSHHHVAPRMSLPYEPSH
jgi:hypothetical protein